MLQLYSMKNIPSKIFGKPMYFHDNAHCLYEVRKMWLEAKQDTKSIPTNFAVYSIGEFDETTGDIINRANPLFLKNCGDLLLEETIEDRSPQTITESK